MKKKLRGYRFVTDAMGPMNVMCLMHPIKENGATMFMLPIKKEKGFMHLFHDLAKWGFCFETYVTATVEYKRIKNAPEYREVTRMKIEKIELVPHEEEWLK